MSAALAIVAGILSSVLTGVVFVLFVLPRQLASKADEARQRAEIEAEASRRRADDRQAQLERQTAEIAERLLKETNRDSVDVANDLLADLRSRARTDDSSSR